MATPTGFENVEATIRQKFDTGWASVQPNVTIAWDNARFRPKKTTAKFVRFSIVPGESSLAAIGATLKQYRNIGIIFIQIFVKEEVGEKTVLELVDSASGIFRDSAADGIIYRAPILTKVGAGSSGAGGWYQVNVSVEYQWDGFL